MMTRDVDTPAQIEREQRLAEKAERDEFSKRAILERLNSIESNQRALMKRMDGLFKALSAVRPMKQHTFETFEVKMQPGVPYTAEMIEILLREDYPKLVNELNSEYFDLVEQYGSEDEAARVLLAHLPELIARLEEE